MHRVDSGKCDSAVFVCICQTGHFEDPITVPLQKLMQIKQQQQQEMQQQQQQQLHQHWQWESQLFQLTQTIILALECARNFYHGPDPLSSAPFQIVVND